jgi:Na+-driven multidrug efflux pump
VGEAGHGTLGRQAQPAAQRREIVRLAVPALGALVAEPLFQLADAAIVGHLGAAQLAGLGASAAATGYAVIYLRISAAGVPAMLLVLAGTGILRGLQDTGCRWP